MPRREWPEYIIDQPRRGRAGYTMSKIDTRNAIPTILKVSAVWDAFRNGIWKQPENPYFFPTTQFPKTPYAVDQFFRQQAPDNGEEPRTDEQRAFMGKTMAKLLEETGPAILITHSNSGQYGWATALEAVETIQTKKFIPVRTINSIHQMNGLP
ncbi:MAG: hypothetical protein EOO89_18005 [Pedobacter sp.]|nr:MAG: hypothetical protein EOO89_18005 [Pedobacter sp.]